MYFMYVDDTGDPGNNVAETSHFGLVGLVLHSDFWSNYLEELIAFRRRMNALHGLKMRENIHAKNLLNKPGPLARIQKYKRLEILHQFLGQLAAMDRFRVMGVLIDKRDKPANYPFFEKAWTTLIQGGAGYRDIPIDRVLEDPNERHSVFSYFVQAADVAAYFLYQSVNPNLYIRKKQARNYYEELAPIFCRQCSPANPWGIVRL